MTFQGQCWALVILLLYLLIRTVLIATLIQHRPSWLAWITMQLSRKHGLAES